MTTIIAMIYFHHLFCFNQCYLQVVVCYIVKQCVLSLKIYVSKFIRRVYKTSHLIDGLDCRSRYSLDKVSTESYELTFLYLGCGNKDIVPMKTKGLLLNAIRCPSLTAKHSSANANCNYIPREGTLAVTGLITVPLSVMLSELQLQPQRKLQLLLLLELWP